MKWFINGSIGSWQPDINPTNAIYEGDIKGSMGTSTRRIENDE